MSAEYESDDCTCAHPLMAHDLGECQMSCTCKTFTPARWDASADEWVPLVLQPEKARVVVVHESDLLALLRRANNGEDPTVLYAEFYANSDHEMKG